MSDLEHIVGACLRCKRHGLKAADFIEAHLRQFLKEQTTGRGRSTFTDARADVHAATKRTEVAGASLLCRECVERQRSEAAAADSVWNDDGEGGGSSSAALDGIVAPMPAAESAEVPDSWEDGDDDDGDEPAPAAGAAVDTAAGARGRDKLTDEMRAEYREAWELQGGETLGRDQVSAALRALGRAGLDEGGAHLQRRSLPGAPDFGRAARLAPADVCDFGDFCDYLGAGAQDYDGPICTACGALVSQRAGWQGRFECQREPGFCCVLGDACGAATSDARVGIDHASVSSLFEALEAAWGGWAELEGSGRRGEMVVVVLARLGGSGAKVDVDAGALLAAVEDVMCELRCGRAP